jgi:hypothetical protein
MFVLAAFVIVIDVIVTLVERRLLVWRPAPSEAKPCRFFVMAALVAAIHVLPRNERRGCPAQGRA